jgi:hypothetical protein
VVAVTGHRDLHPTDISDVRIQIRELIELILVALPHTPIHFLSALADGADQLFAEQVLAAKRTARTASSFDANRIKLIVPLPMDSEDYCLAQEKEARAFGVDPRTPSSPSNSFKTRFSNLTQHADRVFTIPHRSHGDEPKSIRPDRQVEKENEPYSRLAQYLNTHAQLLIAIWDGQTPTLGGVARKAGGTLDVLLTRLKGFDRVKDSRSARSLAEQERGPVVHVRTRRASSLESVAPPSAAGKCSGFCLLKIKEGTSGRIDRVVRVRGTNHRWNGIYMPKCTEWLRTPVRAAALFQERHVWRKLARHAESALGRAQAPPALAVLYGIWTAGREIDSFNQHHQRALNSQQFSAGESYRQLLSQSTQYFVGSLAPVTGERMEHGDDMSRWPLKPQIDALAPLLQVYAVAGVLAQRAKKTWGWRWLLIAAGAVIAGASSSFKVLYPPRGELIEAGAFLAGAGLAISTYLWVTLSNQRNAYLEYRALAEGLRFQMYWMAAGNHALVTDHYVQKFRSELGWVRRALDGLMVLPRIPSGSALAVARGWIKDQSSYLKGPENKLRRQQNLRATNRGNNLLLLGLALAAVVSLLSLHSSALPAIVIPTLIISMKLTSAIGAAWLSYNGKMAHGETLKQVGHLKGVYTRASTVLDGIESGDQTVDAKEAQASDLLIALGKEALAENANWLSNYQQRKVTWSGR